MTRYRDRIVKTHFYHFFKFADLEDYVNLRGRFLFKLYFSSFFFFMTNSDSSTQVIDLKILSPSKFIIVSRSVVSDTQLKGGLI